MSGLAVITGASSGIGQEYARRLARQGTSLIVVGRREERLAELANEFPEVPIQTVAADIATESGLQTTIATIGNQPVTLLVNNAGVAHYGPFAELAPANATELIGVKVLAPTRLARAVVPGMIARGQGSIVNVAGMIAFSGPATLEQVGLRRSVYASSLAYTLTFSQTLQSEISQYGIGVQALLPGVVATEFHERQGTDLSQASRMTVGDVVTASLRGLELGENVTAPGVEHRHVLQKVFDADLAAFEAQSTELAARYRN